MRGKSISGCTVGGGLVNSLEKSISIPSVIDLSEVLCLNDFTSSHEGVVN